MIPFLSYLFSFDASIIMLHILVINSFGLGSDVRVKVLARGYDDNNEGLLVKLPNSELDFYDINKKACITIGLSSEGKARDTADLEFKDLIKNKFLEGKKGICIDGNIYYDVEAININSTSYCLTFDNNRYSLDKVQDKKMFSK